MASLIGKLRFQSSMKPTRGRAVPVYDGRSWPVVKCGPVYVTEDEKAKHVTKSVIAKSTAPEDKKKKSSKYSVAVGSSFGHVHSFLKDSDHVLKEFDKTEAEDKCLLLIRKPKSASKQMFKAHSLAALNVQDPHLTLPDGTTKPEPALRFFKHKAKHKTELSVPIHSGTLTKPRSQSQGSPVSELSSAYENDHKTTQDILSDKQNKTSDTKFSYMFPYEEMFSHKSSFQMRPRTNTDTQEGRKEINNNNKMGGGFTKLRPRAAPPAVPTKTNTNTNKTRTDISSAVHNENQVSEDTTNNNRPDLLSNVESRLKAAQSVNDNIHTAVESSSKSNKSQQRYSGNVSENWNSQMRRKHDSGFHSDITSTSDKLYYSGFKSELNSNDLHMNNKNMASSSTPLNQDVNFETVHLKKDFIPKNVEVNNPNADQKVHKTYPKVHTNRNDNTHNLKSNISSDGVNTEKKCVRNPHPGQKTRPYSSGPQHIVSNKIERKVSPHSPCLATSNANNVHPHHVAGSHVSVHDSQQSDTSHAREHPSVSHQGHLTADYHGVKKSNENCTHKGKNIGRHSSANTNCKKRHSLSPKQRIPNEYSQMHNHHSPRGCSQMSPEQLPKEVQSKTGTYIETAVSIHSPQVSESVKENFEKEDPVFRAQSLGDLTAGCTFSLVGQKKSGSVQALTETEFTGSQLAKHFRKYREMKPELNHGSLPGRMKCTGNETTMRPSLENMNIQADSQLQVYTGQCKKQHHYGSLQHLPMSETKEHRDLPSIRNREKTPIKPRRTLPQVPGDADEKKKQYTDIVKIRLSSRNSTSPNSRNSNRPHSSENRQGGISATPSFSDREVSELLEGTAKDYIWMPASSSNECNKIPQTKSDVIPPDAVYDKLALSYPMYSTGPFVSHDHNAGQTGTRHCESGQNTITSQSTVDSGYITNDPETDNNTTLSTSNYAKSLKESSNKLFKQSKGDYAFAKVDSSNIAKQHKDHDTQKWIDKHPGVFLKEINPKNATKEEVNANFRSTNDKKNPVNDKSKLDEAPYITSKKQLTHRVSEISLKEAEKFNQERKYFKPKVKAVSMSYGLNLIESNTGIQNNNVFSKTQPKFTGSLINLTHTESQGLTCAPSLDSLKDEVKNATLPGGWKYFGANRTESSLKMLGKPSLFQLLQNYSVHPVRLKIPENVSLLDNIRLLECEVVLPSPWKDKKEVGTVMSPKGSYAKLGGPNSAFKPVGGSSTIGSVSMVTIVDITSGMNDFYELGEINKGDLIVEVNERLVIGDDFMTLTKLLQTCQGELLLTIARDKARERQKLSVPKEEELRKMEAKIAHLTKEMRKKDRTLKQLNALLPWKQDEDNDKNIDTNSQEICNLSEDEFIV